MTDERGLPPMERVWLIEATYAPDAAESRKPVRAEHFARIIELMRAGIVLEAGGLTDMSASILMLRAESEAAALAIARDDVYVRAGVWVELRARPFARVATE